MAFGQLLTGHINHRQRGAFRKQSDYNKQTQRWKSALLSQYLTYPIAQLGVYYNTAIRSGQLLVADHFGTDTLPMFPLATAPLLL
jgi:hypothetical protein